MSLLERIMEHEGFRPRPYQCPNGVWTIGHGLTYLTKEESEHIVKGRIIKLMLHLRDRHNDWLTRHYTDEGQEILLGVMIEMCFQMGIRGFHRFVNTIAYLKKGQPAEAAVEMLDSFWARSDSPSRARELSDIVMGVEDHLRG